MNSKKIRGIGAAVLAAVWLGLALAAWFHPPKDISDTERRKLEQFPELTGQTLLSGKFMSKFETYSLDQFPLRDNFRQLKALFHYDVLGQKDNNGIYIADGYAAKLEYPLNRDSVENAVAKFTSLYESFLKPQNSRVFAAVVPDKNYYLAAENGYPAMDYEALFAMVKAGMPWAEYVDLTDCLNVESYYRTDTHWRQEKLLPAAGKLAEAMGVTPPRAEDFTPTAMERPFYGVYYGQAALPMTAETMYTMESALLRDCSVFNFETNAAAGVYDEGKYASRDLYDVYLSGAAALLTIENPGAKTDRELIVFRDSFGSSMVPLLVQDYARVTLVDTRYILPSLLPQFLDFHGQDVLFLYSALILNNSQSLK